MTTMRTLGLAIGIAFAASSFALAQQGNSEMNAAASGGAGTHQNSPRTGSAETTQKATRNLHGYNGYRGVYSYYPRFRYHHHHGRYYR
jgi:hypothetical protein